MIGGLIFSRLDGRTADEHSGWGELVVAHCCGRQGDFGVGLGEND